MYKSYDILWFEMLLVAVLLYIFIQSVSPLFLERQSTSIQMISHSFEVVVVHFFQQKKKIQRSWEDRARQSSKPAIRTYSQATRVYQTTERKGAFQFAVKVEFPSSVCYWFSVRPLPQ